jgi:hypothetical protein
MSPTTRVILAALVVGAVAVFWLRDGDLPTPKAPPSVESAPARQASGLALRENAGSKSEAGSQHAADAAESVGHSPPSPELLNEQTLVNTTWGRDGFELEFAPGGVLRIGGRERASWQVIGDSIRLYDHRGEEHWLDIENGRVTWNGEEVGRVK